MARKTAGSLSPGDEDGPEGKPRRSAAAHKARTTEPRVVRDARTVAKPVDWLELFPSEDVSRAPEDPAPVHQTSQFYVSASATASEFRRDPRPRSLIVPSRFVDAKKPETSLATIAPAMKRVAPPRWHARRRWHSMVRAATALRGQVTSSLKARSWRSDRGAWILGSLACLILLGPSVANRSSTTGGTIGQGDVQIAAVVPSLSPFAPSPSAASSPIHTVAEVPRPADSATVHSSAQPTPSRSATRAPASVHVTGTLIVTSEPAGAAVFMNQRYVGITPLETSVKAGSYAVIVELDQARWTDVVLVRGERVTRVQRVLQLNRFPLPISPFR